MRTQSWRSLVLLALVTATAVPAAFGYVAIINKTDHTGIHILPTPGKVTIDGDLADWDLSGAILMYLDEASKGVYSVRGAMMYDAEALYVGGQVKDPTPMVNNYAFGGEANMSWNADAIQLRFVSNPDVKSKASIQTGGHMSAEDQKYVNHITLWYSTQDQKAGYFAMYTLGFADPTLNPAAVTGAYRKDADGKGYAFEYRIPWAVLRAPRPLKAGDQVQVQYQLHWGNDLGQGLRCGMTDVRDRSGDADLGYMGPRCWGTGIFEAKGQIKLEEKTLVGRAPGHIPVTFKLAKDSKVSLGICNAAGQLVRTGLGAEPLKAGEQTWLWDGLDDSDRPVPPGTYQVKLLTHGGVRQQFVCDVGVSGTPPYQTENGTGGWAGDYGEPQFVATEGDRVVLGTRSAEAAPATIGTDLEGRKAYGTAAAGGALVLHKGFGYFVGCGNGKLLKFETAKGYLAPFPSGRPETAIITKGPQEDGKAWGSRSWQLYAIAAVGDLLVVSSFVEDKLYLLDVATGTPKGEGVLKAPVGLAADAAGMLYAVSEKAVGRYDLKAQQFTLLLGDLDQPRQLACDAAGNVYVSLRGQTMQVWKLSREGKVLLKYGKAGGRPALGKFDAAGMLNPDAIAVDRNNRLWVCEQDSQPKRYSVWNPDGTLYRDFYGSMDYATSAYFDPETPQYVYAQCVRYRVDYDKGTWQPDATILRPTTVGKLELSAPMSHGGATFVKAKGRKFLVVNPLTIYEVVGDRFVPRLCSAAAGRLWIDDNNDGQVQDAEFHDNVPHPRYYWSAITDPDLNLYEWGGIQWHSQGGAKTTQPYTIKRWDFLGFGPQGGLQFGDFGKATNVAADAAGGAVAAAAVDAARNVFVLVSGGTLQRGVRAQGSGHRVVKFSSKGDKEWEYQNVHCAFAWTSDSYTPGYLVGVLRFSLGDHPDLVALTGYYGQYFLLDKKDGLFVDALGEDQRTPYVLGQHMVLTENFNGTLFKHPQNGKTYFLGGDADCRLWELTGLDTVKRDAVTVTVTPAMVAKAEQNARQNFAAEQAALGVKLAKVPRLKQAAADGKYDEWGAAPTLTMLMEAGRSAMAQLGYDDQNLYARFQIGDDSPLVNTPTDYRLLFKSGDAVEVCLTPDVRTRPVHGQNQQEMAVGDTRIVIARKPDGKMVATRYRPKIAGAEKPNQASFETQSSGKETFDEMVAWDDLPMHCRADKDGCIVEVAIPWAALGIVPKPGLALSGDVGVIYGNQGGTRNAIRYLWSDKSAEVSINNDIPSELRLHVNQWGKLLLE